jgi:hypothetical protein
LLPQSRNGQALFKRIPYSTSIKGENFNTISSLITTHLDTVIDCRGWGVVPYLPKNRDKLPKKKSYAPLLLHIKYVGLIHPESI